MHGAAAALARGVAAFRARARFQRTLPRRGAARVRRLDAITRL
jgi:hypothetical protein